MLSIFSDYSYDYYDMLSIQRLNMDNTWVLRFGKTSILVDPWLFGSEVDFFSWFNEQWHRTKPVELEAVPDYDFVVITQKYPDHFHKETLQALNPGKIIVPSSIEKQVSKLLPSADVITLDNDVHNAFGSDINIHFLPTGRKMDPIYDALIIESDGNSVFLATHGFTLSDNWLEKAKQIAPFNLLITPFNHFKLPKILGGDVSPGIESVKNLQSILEAEKVVATHDEDKHAKGIVSKLAKIKWAPNKTTLSSEEYFGSHYLHIDHYQLVTL